MQIAWDGSTPAHQNGETLSVLAVAPRSQSGLLYARTNHGWRSLLVSCIAIHGSEGKLCTCAAGLTRSASDRSVVDSGGCQHLLSTSSLGQTLCLDARIPCHTRSCTPVVPICNALAGSQWQVVEPRSAASGPFLKEQYQKASLSHGIVRCCITFLALVQCSRASNTTPPCCEHIVSCAPNSI